MVSVSQADRPEPRLDPACRQESLRTYCRDLRAWYRAHPGLLARAEDLTALAAPEMVRIDDAVVGFFLHIGLSPHDAHRAWAITVLQVAGFAEVWDAWHDRPPAGADPTCWTGLPPIPLGGLPHLARVAEHAVSTAPDLLCASVLDMLVVGIEAML